MPRTPIIVHLDDGKDHLIIDGEVTGCGQAVPHGTEWVGDSTTRACSICFPDGKVKDVEAADESELLEAQQEKATKGRSKRAA